MVSYKKIFFLIIPFSLLFCASKPVQNKFPQEIEAVYFQKWLPGLKNMSSGTNFYIKFKTPLSKNIQLQKVHLQGQEAKLEQEDQTTLVAHFYQKSNHKDLNLNGDSEKEYGNQIPESTKSKFKLKPDEAILEYKWNNKKTYFIITNIKEKELIAYPSMKPEKE